MMQPPKIGIDQFWDVLIQSRLIAPAELQQIREKAATITNSEDAESIANWLVREKILTPLQTKVLLAGHSGPFEFGRYRLVGGDPQRNVWMARDRKTTHPVWLHFFAGDTRKDLARWDQVEDRAEALAKIEHPNLVRVYESVVTRSHRFLATAVGGKDSLDVKMPLKRRLTESQAIEIVRDVASGVAELEANGLSHGSLSLEAVYANVKDGSTRLMPPVVATPNSQARSDVNALGRMLFRLLTGRDAPEPEKLLKVGMHKFTEKLAERKLSQEIGELAYESMVDDDSMSADAFLKRLDAVAGDSKKTQPQTAASSTESAFVAGLTPWKQSTPVDDEIPDLAPEDTDRISPKTPIAKPKWQLPVAATVGLTLLGFAALLGIGAVLANLKKFDTPRFATNDDVEDTERLDPEMVAEASDESPAEPKRKTLAELLATQSYVQELIADDQETLWESPTTGFPIDVSSLPPSPRMIAAINWRSIYDSPTGVLSLRAFGPRVESLIANFESRIGFPMSEVDSTVISMHSNLSFEYDSFVVVTLQTPTPLDSCLQNWEQPSLIPGIENAFEQSSGESRWIAKTDPDTGNVVSFVVGPSELVQQVAQGEVAALSGTLRRLVGSSDRSRDANFILPVISLFNTEGQKLFADYRKWMNELRLTLPEPVVGLAFSFHLDDGDYVEVRVDHTSDLKSKVAAVLMRDRIASKLEQVQLSVQQRQALPFWEPVRARYAAMLRDLSKQLRWDAEFGEVIGNAWLSPGALHNLAAGTELAMAFEPAERSVASVAETSATPQNLEELLATRRDLTIANPPDLNVLLRNIREEISDQYLDLPFEFNIQINGTDLQKDGITQNQRPGPLQIKDKSVSEILTQVMVSANPNKEISGPADANCKLVWVITEDPESPGKKFVLVTTRAAAAQKDYVLPEVFRVQP
ncbi:protein kinase [Mariniblastus fucicola]|uniref:Protein kinase domain protein n=1 Tax=Mariniblastus fucicola TaxID=980251 RepID=A0A5B9P6W1_9BACT|nr:protein kinase [Mariniblastus fucicola]QEG21279.1 Protein kinase domain protein [Mariniblastus fucicola]